MHTWPGYHGGRGTIFTRLICVQDCKEAGHPGKWPRGTTISLCEANRTRKGSLIAVPSLMHRARVLKVFLTSKPSPSGEGTPFRQPAACHSLTGLEGRKCAFGLSIGSHAELESQLPTSRHQYLLSLPPGVRAEAQEIERAQRFAETPSLGPTAFPEEAELCSLNFLLDS